LTQYQHCADRQTDRHTATQTVRQKYHNNITICMLADAERDNILLDN